MGGIITTEPFVLYSDTCAAKVVTGIKGWVSRLGHFYGDNPGSEHLARWDGCTHVPCSKCGQPTPKMYTACDCCQDRKAIERYAARKREPWDGVALIYSESSDAWFTSLEEVLDHCATFGITPESLLLVLGAPVYAGTIDPVEHYVDDLPDDCEGDDGCIPSEIVKAFEALNKVIEECKTPLSWKPGEVALDLECLNLPAQER